MCDSPRHFKDYTNQRDKDGLGVVALGVKYFVYVVRLPEVWTVLRLWNAVKHIMMDDCVTAGIQIQLDSRQSHGFGGHGRLFFSSWKVC